MYDFIKFIDILNNKPDSFYDALNLIKNDFHIGKVVIKSTDSFEYLEYNFDKNYINSPVISYSNGGYDYIIYKNSDSHKYNEEEIKDITLLIRVVALHHKNYLLNKKATEGEFVSFNTKLPNTHGYIKKIEELVKYVDPELALKK